VSADCSVAGALGPVRQAATGFAHDVPAIRDTASVFLCDEDPMNRGGTELHSQGCAHRNLGRGGDGAHFEALRDE
jgi:hypothetical protein